jgi:hypothetical protein
MSTNDEQWSTSSNSGAWPSYSLESLRETIAVMAKLPPLPREVFRFDGTLEEFRSALARLGVTEATPAVFPPLSGLTFPPLGSLEVHEIDGRCWIAPDYRDIKAARAGMRPFSVIDRKST